MSYLKNIDEFVNNIDQSILETFTRELKKAKSKVFELSKTYNDSNVNIEIEFRFKRPSYKINTTGSDLGYGDSETLDVSQFMRIKHYFEKLDYDTSVSQSKVISWNTKRNYKSDQSTTFSMRRVENIATSEVYFEKKQKIILIEGNQEKQLNYKKVNAPYSYFSILGAAIEIPVLEEVKIPTKNITTRIRDRVSYKIDDLGILDLTTVIENNDKKYEVEFELINPFDNDTEDYYERILEFFLLIVSIRDDGYPVPFMESKKALLSVFNELGDHTAQTASLTVPLVQPRDIERNDIKVNKLLGDLKYIVTQKIDGIRKILIHYENLIYIAYPLRDITCIDYVEGYSSKAKVLDGEFIREDDKVYFYPFDALTDNEGNSVYEDNWYERRSHIDNICSSMGNYYFDNFKIYHKIFYQLPRASKNITLSQAGQLGNIYSYCLTKINENSKIEAYETVPEVITSKQYLSKDFDKRHVEYTKHKIDGIIFIPANDVYNRTTPLTKGKKNDNRINNLIDANKKDVSSVKYDRKNLLQCPKTLKWKPPNLLTLDFFHYKNEIDQLDFKVSIGMYEDEMIPFKDVIKEDSYVISLEGWKDEYYNKIGEWLYENNEFRLIKIRPDKLRPNKKFSAINTWKLVNHPIKWNDLILKTDMFYRNAINNWKRRIIKYTSPECKTLIDIGTGRGGDLSKFFQSGFTNMVLIEPNQHNRQELYKRLKDNFKTDNKSNKIFIVAENAQNHQTITSLAEYIEIIENKNLISSMSMLSLTFFFDKENELVDLLRTMKPLGKNTILTFFTVDGFSLLHTFSKKFVTDNPDSDMNSEQSFLDYKLVFNKEEGYRDYKFTKRHEGDLRVEVSQSSKEDGIMGLNQIEYLVDPTAISEALNADYEDPNISDNEFYAGYRPYIDNILTLNDIYQLCIHKVYRFKVKSDNFTVPTFLFKHINYTANIFKPMNLDDIDWKPITREKAIEVYVDHSYSTKDIVLSEEKVKDQNTIYRIKPLPKVHAIKRELNPLTISTIEEKTLTVHSVDNEIKDICTSENIFNLTLNYYCVKPYFITDSIYHSFLNSLLYLYQTTQDYNIKYWLVLQLKEQIKNLIELNDHDPDDIKTGIEQIFYVCDYLEYNLCILKDSKVGKYLDISIISDTQYEDTIFMFVENGIYSLVVKREKEGFATFFNTELLNYVNN